jgi:hypothetical protein
MSYSSCLNSAILPYSSPPSGAIGWSYTPVINTAATASGANSSIFQPWTAPKGKWLLSGSIFPDAFTPGQAISGLTYFYKNGGNPICTIDLENSTTAPHAYNGFPAAISVVFESDGNDVISTVSDYTTEDGSTYTVANPTTTGKTTLVFTRIA